MKTYIIQYRKLYHIEMLSDRIDAFSFADAENKFNMNQEENNLLLISITLASELKYL